MTAYTLSDEAKEAAARALFADWFGDMDLDDAENAEMYREAAEAALVAAYPHMVADAMAAVEERLDDPPLHVAGSVERAVAAERERLHLGSGCQDRCVLGIPSVEDPDFVLPWNEADE